MIKYRTWKEFLGEELYEKVKGEDSYVTEEKIKSLIEKGLIAKEPEEVVYLEPKDTDYVKVKDYERMAEILLSVFIEETLVKRAKDMAQFAHKVPLHLFLMNHFRIQALRGNLSDMSGYNFNQWGRPEVFSETLKKVECIYCLKLFTPSLLGQKICEGCKWVTAWLKKEEIALRAYKDKIKNYMITQYQLALAQGLSVTFEEFQKSYAFKTEGDERNIFKILK